MCIHDEIITTINPSRHTCSHLRIFTPQVTEVCQQMKENMYMVYEENSSEMQLKLQELTEVLESCTKLSKELMEASQALEGLREGLAISQTSEP